MISVRQERMSFGMGPGMDGPFTMRMMMALADTDNDGTTSLQEFQTHERIFKAMDTNKDGRLTLEELQNFMSGTRTTAQQQTPAQQYQQQTPAQQQYTTSASASVAEFTYCPKHDAVLPRCCPNAGCQAQKIAEILNLQSGVLARPKRFELLTPRFVVWCSIQLSYGRFVPPPGCEIRGTERPYSYRFRPLLARVGAASGRPSRARPESQKKRPTPARGRRGASRSRWRGPGC